MSNFISEHRDNPDIDNNKIYGIVVDEKAKAYRHSYYLEHREHLIKLAQQYRLLHKEEMKDKEKQYRLSHKEESKQYRLLHKEERKQYELLHRGERKQYLLLNKEKIKAQKKLWGQRPDVKLKLRNIKRNYWSNPKNRERRNVQVRLKYLTDPEYREKCKMRTKKYLQKRKEGN